MKKFYLLLLSCFFIYCSFSQSVLNPADSVITYNSANPPTQPAYGQIGKWVRTQRLSWNTNEYKCYIYKGCEFRLHFPKSYNPTANDGKKYPLLVFFHGLGEAGTIYDNEYQLYHGGDVFQNAVDNGTFDGFVLCMQSQGFWGSNQYQNISEIIDYMIINNKLDPFAISANGLSAGGQGTWEMLFSHTTYIAADVPMSSMSISYTNSDTINKVKFTPVWDVQGGLDGSPAPYTAHQVRDAMIAAGANLTYTEFPTQGHDTWDSTWLLPDFFPYLLRGYGSNPYVLYGRTKFCPSDTINVTIGLPPGFDTYQWRYNGNLITGATSNSINATQAGMYDARVQRNGLWSDWSRTPVQIIVQTPGATAPIQTVGLMSQVIPGADGKNYVNLQVSGNGTYTSYTWKKVGSDSVYSNQSIFKATQPGYYIVAATPQYSCSALYSSTFKVIDAKGPNAPVAAKGLSANVISTTQIQLAWSKPAQQVNAPSAFEIYRGTMSGTYNYVGKTLSSVLNYIDSSLAPKIKYYYVVRAVDSTGAAALSNEASIATYSDTTAPSVPANLKYTATTSSTISIVWSASTDNVAVDHYNIYVNGALTNITKQTSFILNSLTANLPYIVYVKAVDASGNLSLQSNQVSATTVQGGLKYSFYPSTTALSILPTNLLSMPPASTGTSTNTDLSVANNAPIYSMLWQGYINVPVAGTYTFWTNSDDGSALWFNSYTPTGTRTVNNDGLHGSNGAAGTAMTLQPGIYPICIEYFQGGGGYNMNAYWSCTQLFGDNNPHIISDNYFTSNSNAIIPAAPAKAVGGLKYSYYPTTTAWSKLPDFTKLTPSSTGVIGNTDLSIAKDPLYGIVWQGYINIPVTGTYIIGSSSDDGSAIWFNSYTATGTPTVNNDGAHAAQSVGSASLTLQAGVYPICIEYFQAGGSSSMYMGWICQQLYGDNNAHQITNDYFVPAPVAAAPILPASGLKYSVYPTTTSWSKLPDFTTITPTTTGLSATTDISVATSTLFGMVWQGYINIPVAGNYTFYTTSDDGSALYFNSLTPAGTPTVNNDGAHANQTAASAVLALQPGIYPICIDYFQAGGGLSMSTYWACPQLFNDNNAHLISSNYFGNGIAGLVPVMPGSVAATANAFNQINVTWTDNSNNETGFEVYRSTSSAGIYSIIGTTAANATSYFDSTVSASTTYYYKVQAINQSGGSGLTGTTAGTGLSYAYYQNNIFNANNLSALNNLIPQKSGTVLNITLTPSTSLTGVYAFKYAGYIKIPTSGAYTFYTNSDDGSNLYIGGFDSSHLIVKNDYNQAATERSGTATLTAGTYPYYLTYRQAGGGFYLSASWMGPNIAKASIPDSVLSVQPFATTLALPAAPATPASFAATSLSVSKISLSWSSVANITNYQLQRSLGDSLHYILLSKPAVGIVNYIDSSLGANQLCYYKLNAVAAGGALSNAAITSATTKDNAPVISKLINQSVHYGTTTSIAVTATDADGDLTSFTGQNLPSFISLTNNGANAASLIINAPANGSGVYNNIKVFATDPYGGKDSTVFTLTVNSNYAPTLDTITNYTLNENDTLSILLTAHDLNTTDTLKWTVTNLPNSFTLIPGSNGNETISLKPNYAAAGSYSPVVTVSDGNGGTVTRQFNIFVNDVNPNTNVYVRFQYQDTIGKPWNSVTSLTANNFVDATGKTTNIGLAFQTSWFATYNTGPTTGNNSGVYPDAVLQDYYYFGAFGGPDAVDTKITGLDTSRLYNLTFFGASLFPGTPNNGSTIYTVGNTSDTLAVQGNTKNTATISNIKPASDGTILYHMSKNTDAQVGYINALVINSIYDDGTAPAAATSLSAQNVSGKGVQLSWNDIAYNEKGYNVYRALNSNQIFSLIGQTQPDATSYVDTTVSGTTQYAYKIAAFNSHGVSAYSNVALITTLNKAPQIAAISDVIIKYNQTATVNITATDDSTDKITLTAANLPSFAKFTDKGNGTGTITVTPGANNVGAYLITVTATDNSNASASTSFNILISDPSIASAYLSFSDGSHAVPKPWNNIGPYPIAGTSFTTINDDSNTPTGITLTFTNGFQGVVQSGMQPVEGSGIYPNVIMRSAEYESSTNKDTILLSGLSTSKLYNFVFFNSHDDGLNGTTNFSIGTQTVTLNATDNITKTVQLNGISPDATGKVYIIVSKATGADYAFISSLIIQSYASTYSNIAPANLRTTTITRNSIGLQWQDKAYSETGYQIWRATDSSGSYILLTTVAANSTSYNDSNLTANKTYYYAVRAAFGSSYSNFSNAVSASTYGYKVYINYTYNNYAPLPWNNTDVLPVSGYTWSNFFDEKGNYTNTGMQLNTSWAGLYSAGVNPLNNSGIYPDSVMIDSYGLYPGQTASLQITGLNVGMKYDFTFFSSSTALGDVNVAYVINGVTTLLNASLNVNGTETIYGVTPDNYGNVTISLAAGTPTSQFGLLGALVIGGYTPSASNITPVLPASQNAQSAGSAQTIIAKTEKIQKPVSNELKAFPNPFHDYFTLSVPSQNNISKVQVMMYDVAGKIVYSNSFSNLYTGTNSLRVVTSGNLVAGVYTVIVVNADTKEIKTIKLIKQ